MHGGPIRVATVDISANPRGGWGWATVDSTRRGGLSCLLPYPYLLVLFCANYGSLESDFTRIPANIRAPDNTRRVRRPRILAPTTSIFAPLSASPRSMHAAGTGARFAPWFLLVFFFFFFFFFFSLSNILWQFPLPQQSTCPGPLSGTDEALPRGRRSMHGLSMAEATS